MWAERVHIKAVNLQKFPTHCLRD